MHLDLVNLLAVMAAALAGGRLAARFGYPSVLGELVVGIALGPALLGLLHITPALTVLAELGVLMMMLYIGMEVDPRELRQASWPGLVAALGGFVLPFGLCFGLARWWGADLAGALFLGIAAGVTALAVNSRILVDLDIMDTRLAHVMMAGALLTDTVCLVALAAVLGAVDGDGALSFDLAELLAMSLRAVLFFAAVGIAGTWLLPRWGAPVRRALEAGLGSRTTGFTLALIVAVGTAQLAELVGLHGLVGAFLAGMFLREQALGRDLAAHLRTVVHDASIGFLAPVFFVTTGFEVSFQALRGDLAELALLVLLATAGKVLGTTLAYLATGRGWREGLVLGAAMNGRGAVEIIVAGIALDAGIIDEGLFSQLVFLAILTTALVPPSLRWGVAWLRARGELVSGRAAQRGVVIVGGGPTATALARALGGDQPVCVIDHSPAVCEQARAAGLEVLQGDALEPAVLEAAGAAQAALLVAATGNPSLNTLIARLARREFGVPEVLAAQAHLEDAAAVLRDTGVRVLFGRAVYLPDWDRLLAEDGAELAELDPADLGEGDLPLARRRDGAARPFEPGPDQDGDRLVVLRRRPPGRLDVLSAGE